MKNNSSINLAFQAEESRLNLAGELPTSLKEPIAIVGMACRLPRRCNTPQELWNLLISGVDGITEIPQERTELFRAVDPDPDQPGKSYAKWMGSLDKKEIESFDAEFFGISPREAVQMDPQQRLLLKCGYESFQDAGYSLQHLKDSKTGIFVGTASSDYQKIQTSHLNQVDGYSNSGSQVSVSSGRLSYFFGLKGPSLTIDTACSSSLVANHYACQSLRTGESNLALVAGVTLFLLPDLSVGFSKAKMLSPSGRCRSFDENADGYVRSEGCITMVLKRLSDAIVDGDRIHALIRSTAVNNDGRSNGLTVPSQEAQTEMIQSALHRSGVQAEHIGYVEAHGTGTKVGDPIEANAILETYGQNRNESNPLWLGSVKSNIGHLEPVSGLAGLLKSVLSLKHGELPGNLHLQTPNPAIPSLNSGQVQVVGRRRPFPRQPDHPAFAAVNSFAFSGTNAHAILEEAPEILLKKEPRPSESGPWVLPLSCRNRSSAGPLLERHLMALSQIQPDQFPDYCFSQSVGRDHFKYRLAISAENSPQAIEKLQSLFVKMNAMGEKEFFSHLSTTLQIPSDVPSAAIANNFLAGQDVNWSDVYDKQFYNRIDTPTYPYNESPLILKSEHKVAEESPIQKAPAVQAAPERHPFLQKSKKMILGENLITINMKTEDYFRDHIVAQRPLFPAAGFVEICNAVASEFLGSETWTFRDLFFFKGLNFELSAPEIQLKFTIHKNEDQNNHSFSIESSDPSGWTKHTIGMMEAGNNPPEKFPLQSSDEEIPDGAHKLYEYSKRAQFDLGPTFCGIEEVHKVQSGVHTIVKTPSQIINREKYYFHPAVLDASFQAAFELTIKGSGLTFVPFSVDEFRFFKPMTKDVVTETLKISENIRNSKKSVQLQYSAMDPQNGLIFAAKGFTFTQYASPVVSQQETSYLQSHAKPLSPLPFASGEQQEHHILFCDENHLQSPLLQYFETHELSLSKVFLAETTKAHPKFLEWNPKNQDFLKQWIAEQSAKHGKPVTITFSCLENPATQRIIDKEDVRDFLEPQIPALFSIYNIALESPSFARLRIFSLNAADVLPGQVHVFRPTPVPGMVRTANLEAPLLQQCMISIDYKSANMTLENLNSLFAHSRGQRELIVSEQTLSRRQLHEASLPNAKASLDSDGVYLITGGTGSLGLEACDWLVANGAKHIVLCSRSGPSDRTHTHIAKHKGVANIGFAEFDISEKQQLTNVIAKIEKEGRSLRGLLHAAGTTFNATLEKQTYEEFLSMFIPKGKGANNLARSSLEIAPDFVIFFSSVTSCLGNPGQLGYGGCNSYLDLLAGYLRSRGVNATSIQLGGVQNTTMTSESGVTEHLTKIGLPPIPKSDVHKALSLATQSPTSVFGAIAINKQTWQKRYKRSGVDELFVPSDTMVIVNNNAYQENTVGETPSQSSMDRPTAVAPSARPPIPVTMGTPHPEAPQVPPPLAAPGGTEETQQQIQSVVASIMGFATPDDIEADSNLADMGLDSLMFVELRTQLGKVFGETIPTSEMFNYPTIHALAEFYQNTATTHKVPPPLPATTEAVVIRAPETAKVRDQNVVNTEVRKPSPSSGGSVETQQQIQSVVASIMGFSSPDDIEVDSNLADMGLDSLMFVELRTQLGKVFGATIPTSEMFNYPTIHALAEFYQNTAAMPVVPTVSVTTTPMDVPPPPPPVETPSEDSLPNHHQSEGYEVRIQNIVAEIMGFSSGEQIDLDGNLADLGLDSLMFVELRTKLQKEYGHAIATSEMFNYPTVSALVAFYRDRERKAA